MLSQFSRHNPALVVYEECSANTIWRDTEPTVLVGTGPGLTHALPCDLSRVGERLDETHAREQAPFQRQLG